MDDKKLHPLLAYLGYEKYSVDTITSHDPDGIEEEARCAAFSITPPGVIEDDLDSDNDTSDQDWFPHPPLIYPYRIESSTVVPYDPSDSNSNFIHLFNVIIRQCYLTLYWKTYYLVNIYISLVLFLKSRRNSCRTLLPDAGRYHCLDNLFV